MAAWAHGANLAFRPSYIAHTAPQCRISGRWPHRACAAPTCLDHGPISSRRFSISIESSKSLTAAGLIPPAAVDVRHELHVVLDAAGGYQVRGRASMQAESEEVAFRLMQLLARDRNRSHQGSHQGSHQASHEGSHD